MASNSGFDNAGDDILQISKAGMPIPVEEQPWYPEWRAAVEALIAAREAREATAEGTVERLEAIAEVAKAWHAYQVIASKL